MYTLNRPKEIKDLLRFYLACVEAEDRRSLRKKLGAIHRTLVSPWEDAEPFFHPEAVEVEVEPRLAGDRRMLAQGQGLVQGPERMFYGYPVFLDDQGFLSPLFLTPVEVEEIRPGCFAVRRTDPSDIQLNHHVFVRKHFPPEELRAIREELEGAFGSFADRLRAAFAALGEELPPLARDSLDPYPGDASRREVWVNRPILFRSDRSPYTAHLRRELEALVRYERLLAEVGSTAAGALFAGTIRGPRGSDSVLLLPVLPLNASQEEAARSALGARLTVVTGPPGTGKSQVVVDLLASCAAAGRPVLFASRNNKAVDVVRERLRELLGEEFDLTLRLGSRAAMAEAREEMRRRIDGLRGGGAPLNPSAGVRDRLEREVARLRREAEETREGWEQLVRAYQAQRLAAGAVARSWQKAWSDEGGSVDPASVRDVAQRARVLASPRPAGWWLRLLRSLLPSRLSRSLATELRALVAELPAVVRTDVEQRLPPPGRSAFEGIRELAEELALFVDWVEAEVHLGECLAAMRSRPSADELARELGEVQRELAVVAADRLRASWAARVRRGGARLGHRLERYFDLAARSRESSKDFLTRLSQFHEAVDELASYLPVWIVTNLSVRNALPLEPAIVDLVVIDEASQCDIPSALPLLFRARRAVVIGDPKQLQHISTLPADEEEELAEEHGVGDLLADWSYNRRSLYAAAEGSVIDSGLEPILLAEHYRSHPEIIEISNQRFYQGRLVLRTDLESLAARVGENQLGLFWHDVRGSAGRTARSAVNEREVAAVLELLNAWAKSGLLLRKDVSFGVVTPFRRQMELLEEAVRRARWWESARNRLAVGTAHRFQGDERDVVIFSPVVARGLRPRLRRWLAETEELLNVSITRARAALHVVGDRAECRKVDGLLGELAVSFDDPEGTSGGHSFQSPAEERLAELLEEAGLWFRSQHRLGRYRLDFLVVGPLGTRYDIEVDGRGHLTDEAWQRDEARDAAVRGSGIRVVRIPARWVFDREDEVRELLRRLA